MKHRIPLIALATAFFFGPAMVFAEDFGQGWSSSPLKDAGRAASSPNKKAPGSGIEWMGITTITPTTFTFQNPYLRLKDIRPDSETPSTSGIRASTPLLNGHLIAESELARNNLPGEAMASQDRTSKSMMRMALSADYGSTRYGLTYRHADRQFLNVPDQEIRELWGEWGMGSLRLRSTVSELFTNVGLDPTRPRLNIRSGRMMMALARPDWPELSLSYARTLTDNNALQSGLVSQRRIADVVEGALSITGSSWNARLSTTYSLSANQLQSADETVSYAQMFTGAFHPIEPLDITSVISYKTDVQQWTGVRTETPVASLAVNYRHSATLMISALGGYTGLRSSDGMTDNETINSKGVITWSPWGSTVHQVSFETGYSRTVLGGVNGGGLVTEDLSGLVRFRLTQF